MAPAGVAHVPSSARVIAANHSIYLSWHHLGNHLLLAAVLWTEHPTVNLLLVLRLYSGGTHLLLDHLGLDVVLLVVWNSIDRLLGQCSGKISLMVVGSLWNLCLVVLVLNWTVRRWYSGSSS